VKQPIWVARQTVEGLHADLLAEHGGAPGLRDQGLLESALARPRQIFAYSTCDLVQLAAAYVAGIVKNHPYIDGNKRTGFMTGYVFLERNGWRFTASEAEAAQAILELAAGTIDETGFALFLKDHLKRARKRAK
jgi:death-on-curing protein